VIDRRTEETYIKIELDLDGTGQCQVSSKIGFLNHMLETLAKHGLFDLRAKIEGDLEVDQHHTVEDTGIALGQAFKEALGDKGGIKRAGFFVFPMDESLAAVAVDLSGRPFLRMDVKFRNRKVGDFNTDLLEDFFQGFVTAAGADLHIKAQGRSDHHKIEAIFKALARALKEACEVEGRGIRSTKGAL
jgi:imidazoleglycerol-phosphate dehydratase